MPRPKRAAPTPRITLKSMACRSTLRASSCRSAPRYWAIWMERAVYRPTRTPWSSQVLELTMPMEAVASAPMWPTMAASMYSMAVTTICSRMDGILNISTTPAVSRRGWSHPAASGPKAVQVKVSCLLLFLRFSCETKKYPRKGVCPPIIDRGTKNVNPSTPGVDLAPEIDFLARA